MTGIIINTDIKFKVTNILMVTEKIPPSHRPSEILSLLSETTKRWEFLGQEYK